MKGKQFGAVKVLQEENKGKQKKMQELAKKRELTLGRLKEIEAQKEEKIKKERMRQMKDAKYRFDGWLFLGRRNLLRWSERREGRLLKGRRIIERKWRILSYSRIPSNSRRRSD